MFLQGKRMKTQSLNILKEVAMTYLDITDFMEKTQTSASFFWDSAERKQKEFDLTKTAPRMYLSNISKCTNFPYLDKRKYDIVNVHIYITYLLMQAYYFSFSNYNLHLGFLLIRLMTQQLQQYKFLKFKEKNPDRNIVIILQNNCFVNAMRQQQFPFLSTLFYLHLKSLSRAS